ncbi:ABC transporter permease [Stratiformator vulcanicus]|uniref:ABC-2 type transporter n=1 Tax=Stratiformator vulcanicus TaxID=2527980 RepID=A0A517QXP2_9PLAN|nr:ABC transporter permease [Stratiformator vulcanicus]QDT36374.1 ABC-2 type transporter [Stratiformator vulcanicus]
MLQHFQELWALRHFLGALIALDLNSRYRGSIIGLGWSVAQPLAMAVVLCCVFQTLFGMNTSDFGPRLLAGLSMWAFITTCAIGGCTAFLSNVAFIKQRRSPGTLYPLRVVGAAAVHLLITLTVSVIANAAFNGPSKLIGLLWILPIAVLLVVIGWLIAICLSYAHAYFRDTAHLVDILLQVAFYLSPILYPLSLLEGRGIGWIVKYNPFGAIVEGLRAPLLCYPSAPTGVYFSILATVVLLGSLAIYLTVKYEHRVVFRV